MENNIIPTVGILIIKNGKVLLVRHGEGAEHLTGRYGIPGGRMEGGESIREAARRELREETALITELGSLVPLSGEWRATIERKDGIKKQFSLVVCLAESFKGRINRNIETTPEWINLKDIDNYDLLPNHKEIIKEGLKFLRM